MSILKQLTESYTAVVESKIELESGEESSMEVNEISKKTLGSYIKKASQSAGDNRINNIIHKNLSSKSLDRNDDETASMHASAADKASKTANKRKDGIAKAVSKLTKEQVEEIEALAAKHGLI